MCVSFFSQPANMLVFPLDARNKSVVIEHFSVIAISIVFRREIQGKIVILDLGSCHEVIFALVPDLSDVSLLFVWYTSCDTG